MDGRHSRRALDLDSQGAASATGAALTDARGEAGRGKGQRHTHLEAHTHAQAATRSLTIKLLFFLAREMEERDAMPEHPETLTASPAPAATPSDQGHAQRRQGSIKLLEPRKL